MPKLDEDVGPISPAKRASHELGGWLPTFVSREILLLTLL